MTDPAAKQREEARAKLVGTTLGRYRIERLLGSGGMGAVFEARSLSLGRNVALKVLDPPEDADAEKMIQRFSREAKAASLVPNDHVAAFLDAGTHEGRAFLVMELLEGEDLGHRLRRKGKLPVGATVHIAAQLLSALGTAHEAGIVHRDLKPDNVFLVKSGNDDLFVKLLDFGMSKIQHRPMSTIPLALTGKGTVLGTPFYMSPEQAQALEDIDGRSDLYGVGAIAYECIAGRPPHIGETYQEVMIAICTTDPVPLKNRAKGVPDDVHDVVMRALARDRSARFRTAWEMLGALLVATPRERERLSARTLSTVEKHLGPLDLPPSTPQGAGGSLALGTTAAVAPISKAFAQAPATERPERPRGSPKPRKKVAPPKKESLFASNMAMIMIAGVALVMGIGVTLYVLASLR